ncbi:cellulose binding domain-containing protein [Streptomyces sp. NPDC058171]
MRRPRTALITALVLVVLALLPVPTAAAQTPAPRAAASAGSPLLVADFRKTSVWDTGHQGSFTVKNIGTAPVTGWTLTLRLPADTVISSVWDARFSREGAVHTFRSHDYNATLAPGGSTSFGWVASGAGYPGTCTVNGFACGFDPDVTPPTVPTGITFSEVGESALTVGWRHSSDDRSSVLDYEVSVDGAAPVTVRGTNAYRATGLSPSTPYLFRIRARDQAGNVSEYSPPVRALTGYVRPGPGTMATAPYVDMGAWPTPSLTELAAGSGLKAFSLGFITATTCRAMWFNQFDPRSGWASDDIAALRALGGEVKVSFGGAGGRELAQTCDSVDALFTEYDALVRQYGLTYADFDIEGSATTDPVSIERRSAALARLQRAHPALRISLTLPVTPNGLTPTGLSVVRSARDAGVTLDVVNIMTMDYFTDVDYGDAAVQAAQGVFDQLRTLFPAASATGLWRMIGVTPMLGENDDHRIYDQQDARQLVEFARTRKLGMLSFWDVTRDRNACTNGHLSLCTNIPQTPYEFSRIFGGYRG